MDVGKNQDIKNVIQNEIVKIKKIDNLTNLENSKIFLLGKNGIITEFMKSLAKLNCDEKKEKAWLGNKGNKVEIKPGVIKKPSPSGAIFSQIAHPAPDNATGRPAIDPVSPGLCAPASNRPRSNPPVHTCVVFAAFYPRSAQNAVAPGFANPLARV